MKDSSVGWHGQFRLQKADFVLDTGAFSLPAEGLTAIFGHSGSGKTTFLRALAGFEPALEGAVYWRETLWQSGRKRLPVHQRRLGFVFQEAGLFEHLSVAENLRYGQKRFFKRWRSPVRFEWQTVIEKLALSALLVRSVHHLSGGERQRVAIGRALLAQPQMLMMDEPLSALDGTAKSHIMPFIAELKQWAQLPILYVTHASAEVEQLADHVVWMAQGQIVGQETLAQAVSRLDSPLYQTPNPQSVLVGQVRRQCAEEGLTQVQVGAQVLWLPSLPLAVGETARILIPALQVSLFAQPPGPQTTSILNFLKITVTHIEPLSQGGVCIQGALVGSEWPLLAVISQRSFQQLDIQVGQVWFASVKAMMWRR